MGLFFVPIAKFEFLPDPYILSKWLVVYLAALVALVVLFLFVEPKDSIVLPKNLWVLSVLLGGAWIFNRIFHQQALYSQASLHGLCFLVLTIYFCWFYKNHKISELSQMSALISLSAVAAIWAQEYLSYLATPAISDINFYSSTFGNINMLGQFSLFALVGLIFYLEKPLKALPKFHATVLYFTFLAILFLSNNRSIYIASGLLLIFALIQRKRFQAKNYQRLLYSLGFVALLNMTGQVNWEFIQNKVPEISFFLGLDEAPGDSLSEPVNSLLELSKPYTLSEKASSTRWRLEILQETLSLIVSTPLGLGTNNFEFGYIPFEISGIYLPRENLILRSPHNELLRIVAEEGVPFSLLLLSFLLLLLYHFIQSTRAHPREKFIVACLGLVFAVEMCFQFPLELPFPFFLASGVLGFLLAKVGTPSSQTDSHPVILNFTFLFAFLLLSTLSFSWFVSHIYQESKVSALTARSCNAMDDNWRGCSNHVSNLLAEEKYDAAQSVIVQELKKEHFNYIALRQWIHLMAKIEPARVCRGYMVYKSIFGGKTRLRPIYDDFCSDENVLRGIELKRAHQKLLAEILKSLD